MIFKKNYEQYYIETSKLSPNELLNYFGDQAGLISLSILPIAAFLPELTNKILIVFVAFLRMKIDAITQESDN